MIDPPHEQTDPAEVTALLGEIRAGASDASGKLAELVYHELRHLAGAIMGRGETGHTLQPTALVHEAWLKLVGHLGSVQDRPHFFAVAATAMRQVLADYARQERSLKRGGGRTRISLIEGMGAQAKPTFDLVAFDDALGKLRDLNERHARVAELRVLGALKIEEIAVILGVTDRTIRSDWAMARSFLAQEMQET